MSFSKRIIEGFDTLYSTIKTKFDDLYSPKSHNHNDIYLNQQQIIDLIKSNALVTMPDMTRSVRIGVNQFNEGTHKGIYDDYKSTSANPHFTNPPNGVPYVLEILKPCFVRIGITRPANRDDDGDTGIVIADTKEKACYYRYVYDKNDAYQLHQVNTALVALGKDELVWDKDYTVINFWNDKDNSQTSGDAWVPLTPGTWVRPGVFGSDSGESWEYWTASICPMYNETPNALVARRHLFVVNSRHNSYINSDVTFGTVSGSDHKIRVYNKDNVASATAYYDISQPFNVIV